MKLIFLTLYYCIFLFNLTFSQNQISCIQTDAFGNLTVNWSQTNDPTNSFISYHLNSTEDGFYNSISSINTTNSTVNPISVINHFFIQSNFSLSSTQYSDTLSNIYLYLNNPSNGTAGLVWNKPSSKNLIGYFKIYQEYPLGTWTLRDSVPYSSTYFIDTIDICNAFLNYQIKYEYNGCDFTSNIVGDNFEDIITPDVPIIQSISYDTTTNFPSLTWNVNPQKDTYGYIIYLKDENGFPIELDTIFGRNNTTFTYQNTNQINPSFSIAAFDSCYLAGNGQTYQTSAKAEIETGISLTSEFDVCNHLVKLSWTNYENWDPLQKYILHIRKDSSLWEVIDTVEYRQYQYYGEPFANYLFTIEVINPDGRKAFSNVLSQTIKAPTTPAINYIEVATVSNKKVEINHLIELTNGVKALSIQKLNNKGKFEEIEILNSPSTNNFFTDNEVEVNRNSYTYRVVVIDSCGNYGDSSNIAKTILLEGNIDQETKDVFLNWNDYLEFNGPILNYEVYRSSNEIYLTNPIATLSKNEFTYTDNVDTIETKGKVCYTIKVKEASNNLNQGKTSVSNEKCFTIEPIVFIPNSFTPNGDRINEVFKPIISIADLSNYELLIFNRWEHPIFESNRYENGWDGTIEGSNQKAEKGTYLYQISFFDGSGVQKVFRGVVNLIR